MLGRATTRSSAKRDLASSSPKPVSRTRATRSASRELSAESETGSARNRGLRRGSRAGSEDSIRSEASNASNASSRAGRTRKATRAATANRDLSMVAENREEEDGRDVEELDTNEAEPQSPVSQISGISGTTAITTHSSGLAAELDPMMAEILPGLYESSYKILELLAPMGVNQDIVENIVNELKTPGSRKSKLLRFEEDRFKLSRQFFGNLGDERLYINTDSVLRKLLRDNPPVGLFRPDAIIHAANLAIMVKMLSVIHRDGTSMKKPLSDLSILFPEPFMSAFDDDISYGSSVLLDDSFALGLEIRTQWVIYNLRSSKGQGKVSPDVTLIEEFFRQPAAPNEEPPVYDDYLQSGVVKNIFRGGPENTDQQVIQILERVKQIYATFNKSEDAIEQDDLVDFERLEEQFSWSNFLTVLMQWSESRLNEIRRSIRQQGGVDSITKALIQEMKMIDSQVDVSYDEPPTAMRPRELLPSANITPGGSGKTLYNGKDSIRRLNDLKKRNSGFSDLSSSSRRAIAESSRPEPTQEQRANVNTKGPAQHLENDRPLDAHDPGPRPTMEYVEFAKKRSNEHNKENRPQDLAANPPKRRLVDPQPDAVRMEWEDTQDPSQRSPSRKRAREEREESEESEDQGFERDRRIPDPARRVAAPAPHGRSPKRQRGETTTLDEDEEEEAAEAKRKSQERASARTQATARSQASRPGVRSPIVEEEDDEDVNGTPAISAIASTARQNVQRMKMATSVPQQRIKWSENDTQRLIELIEDYGCSWAHIEKIGGFEHDRGQVALKDKARNLKVLFLKADTQLPANFNQVRLGAKELKIVRAVHPEYVE